MIKCKIVPTCVVEVDGTEENLIETESDLSGLENTEGYFCTVEEIEEIFNAGDAHGAGVEREGCEEYAPPNFKKWLASKEQNEN